MKKSQHNIEKKQPSTKPPIKDELQDNLNNVLKTVENIIHTNKGMSIVSTHQILFRVQDKLYEEIDKYQKTQNVNPDVLNDVCNKNINQFFRLVEKILVHNYANESQKIDNSFIHLIVRKTINISKLMTNIPYKTYMHLVNKVRTYCDLFNNDILEHVQPSEIHEIYQRMPVFIKEQHMRGYEKTEYNKRPIYAEEEDIKNIYRDFIALFTAITLYENSFRHTASTNNIILQYNKNFPACIDILTKAKKENIVLPSNCYQQVIGIFSNTQNPNIDQIISVYKITTKEQRLESEEKLTLQLAKTVIKTLNTTEQLDSDFLDKIYYLIECSTIQTKRSTIQNLHLVFLNYISEINILKMNDKLYQQIRKSSTFLLEKVNENVEDTILNGTMRLLARSEILGEKFVPVILEIFKKFAFESSPYSLNLREFYEELKEYGILIPLKHIFMIFARRINKPQEEDLHYFYNQANKLNYFNLDPNNRNGIKLTINNIFDTLAKIENPKLQLVIDMFQKAQEFQQTNNKILNQVIRIINNQKDLESYNITHFDKMFNHELGQFKEIQYIQANIEELSESEIRPSLKEFIHELVLPYLLKINNSYDGGLPSKQIEIVRQIEQIVMTLKILDNKASGILRNYIHYQKISAEFRLLFSQLRDEVDMTKIKVLCDAYNKAIDVKIEELNVVMDEKSLTAYIENKPNIISILKSKNIVKIQDLYNKLCNYINLKKNNDDYVLHLYQIECLVKLSHYEWALDRINAFKTIFSSEEDNLQLSFYSVACYSALGNSLNAIEITQQIQKRNPSIFNLLKLAKLLGKSGHTSLLIEQNNLYERLLNPAFYKLLPDKKDLAIEGLVRCLQKRNKSSGEAEPFLEMIKDATQALIQQARMYRYKNMYLDAVKCYTSIQDFASNGFIINELLIIYSHWKNDHPTLDTQISEQIEAWSHTLENNTQYIKRVMIDFYMRHNEFNKAYELAKNIVDNGQHTQYIFYKMCFCLKQLGRINEALNLLECSDINLYDNHNLVVLLAECYIAQNRISEAAIALEYVMGAFSYYLTGYIKAINFYIDQNNVNKVDSCWENCQKYCSGRDLDNIEKTIIRYRRGEKAATVDLEENFGIPAEIMAEEENDINFDCDTQEETTSAYIKNNMFTKRAISNNPSTTILKSVLKMG